MIKYFLIIISILLFYSCKDNAVTNQQNVSTPYNKILEVSNDTVKYELYSASGSMLFSSYNELGIKVYLFGVEQTSGYVRYAPRMAHFIGFYAHGTPVKPLFYYDIQKGLFSGYASYIMVSDSNSIWLGDYSYNGNYRIRDSVFYVYPNSTHKMAAWPNIADEHVYYLSLITPFNPVLGMNEVRMVLSRTHNDTLFTEVDSCQMYFRTFVSATGQTSSGNINPVWLGGGKYKGYVNLPFNAVWSVYDSIIYQGVMKTNSPPAELILDVH